MTARVCRIRWVVLAAVLAALVLGALLWGVAGPILAQTAAAILGPVWTNDGEPVCTALGDQTLPGVIHDGSEGAIIYWQDERYPASTGIDIYAQHVLSDGTTVPGWASNGISVTAALGDQTGPQATGDAADGAFIAWVDDPFGDGGGIYAQRVLSDGTLAWLPPTGITVANEALTQTRPWVLTNVDVQAMGVVWEDHRSGNADIYSTQILSDGSKSPLWPSAGLTVCNATGDQTFPVFMRDLRGGAIVVWQDERNSGTTGVDIYAQRVISDGTIDVNWPTNGITVSAAIGDQLWPSLAYDGDGGVIIAWADNRRGDWDIFAQRVLSDGTTAWSTDGITICAAVYTQTLPWLAPSGIGGAIIAWEDYRGGGVSNIYARRVLNGVPLWAPGGIAVTAVTADSQRMPKLVPDQAKGAIVAWFSASASIGRDIWANRIRPNGTLDWPVSTWPNGFPICTDPAPEDFVNLARDGSGGAYIVWRDARLPATHGTDVYAQRFGPWMSVYLPTILKNY